MASRPKTAARVGAQGQLRWMRSQVRRWPRVMRAAEEPHARQGVGLLRLEAVCKRYGRGRWVLQDVDLEIPAGEVAAIAGANGSGKSTLLRLLVGLSRPTRGTVSGQPEVIGYVPDRFSPQERLSAMEYLTHLGRIRGLSTSVAAARADQLALVGGKQSPLGTLSRGNAQEVALAQALLVQPQLLVLDEPWSGLDASAHGTLADIIAEVAGAGGLVVFTDHRESITAAYASQAYVVSAGQVTRGGTERAIDGRPKIDVVLTEPSGPRKPREVDWYAVDGVLDVTSQVETVTVRVARDCSDALLLTALQHSWSVTSLGPIDHRRQREAFRQGPAGVRQRGPHQLPGPDGGRLGPAVARRDPHR